LPADGELVQQVVIPEEGKFEATRLVSDAGDVPANTWYFRYGALFHSSAQRPADGADTAVKENR
jgi:hypothetical protein